MSAAAGGPLVVVVMGTTSTGKSSVGERLAAALDAGFVEGDDLHPQANVDKMASGTPLTDDDRWPWLDRVAARIRGTVADGQRLVVTCSALKRSYRDVLRGDPATAEQVFFCHLAGSRELLEQRIAGRRGHFMPTSLLDSQLDTLEELGPEERGARVDVAPPLDEVVAAALRELSAR
ncbi:gluconokinase [Nocardioides marmoraquaticus]